jgi:RHS repeat-associated protein
MTSQSSTTTATYGYGAVVGQFTSKERDIESGLDYFGARYYSGAQGRFTSPDSPLADQSPEDPQSWNLYAYVRNNPLAHIDPTGQACFALNKGSAFCGRATEYGQIDAQVRGQTRFFAAASAVSQALANSDVGYGGFISRMTPQMSGTTQGFLSAVGSDLQKMNVSAANEIQAGTLSGPNLDARMVHMEQSKVQGSLDSLKKSDPAAYQTLMGTTSCGSGHKVGLNGAPIEVIRSNNLESDG